MNVRTRFLAATIFLLTGLAAALAPVAVEAQKNRSYVVNLTIHGDSQTNYTVLPDTDTAGNFRNAYTDYRSPGGDGCVQGEVYPTGLASIVTNRRMFEGGPLCAAAQPPGAPRNFRLLVESADACTILGAQSAPCLVTPLAAERGLPHIRAETVFKSKTQTAMTFYFALPDTATADPSDIIAYRLTSDALANFGSPDANTKIVSYTGTGTLAQHFGNPGGYVAVSGGIPMRMAMTFTRVTVP